MKWMLAIMAIMATPAVAQNNCAGMDQIAAGLAARWGETQVFSGLDQRGGVLRVFVAASGTWTAVMEQPDGQGCIVAAGDAGQLLPAGVEG